MKLISTDLRLIDGSIPGKGRVELFFNGSWGTVCDVFWDNLDAKVVCRQLGFSDVGAIGLTADAYFVSIRNHSSGSGSIVLFDVRCAGNENSLDQCQRRGWGNEDIYCASSGDAGVMCGNETGKNISLNYSNMIFFYPNQSYNV